MSVLLQDRTASDICDDAQADAEIVSLCPRLRLWGMDGLTAALRRS
jgi:hypothetical protein